MIKRTYYGHTSGITGHESGGANDVLINLGHDGMAVFTLAEKSDTPFTESKAWAIYSKFVRITVEEVSEREVMEYHKRR